MKRNIHYLLHLHRSLALAGLTLLASGAQADGGGAYSVYDSNRDGYLDRQEFIPFAESRKPVSGNDDFWQFDRVDQDGDNRISEQEMVNALIESLQAGKQ